MMPANLTQQENELLATMLRGNRKIEIAVPDTLEPKQILTAVRSTCSMLSKAERMTGRLMAVLGRLMILTSRQPEVWKQAGYKSYGEFVKGELETKLGRSRASLYEARKIMTAFPNLELSSYSKIPTNNLLLLTKFTSSDARDSEKLLDLAGSTSHEKFKTILVDKGYLGSEDVSGGKTLKITGPAAKVQRLINKLANEKIHAHVGSTDALEILTAAMISLEQELKPE